MPHFNVHVFTADKPTAATLADILEPYDLNLPVDKCEPHVEATHTPEQVQAMRYQCTGGNTASDDRQFLRDWYGLEVEEVDGGFDVIGDNNTNARWEQWAIGGQWEGALAVPGGADIARVADLGTAGEDAPEPVAFIDRDGNWHDNDGADGSDRWGEYRAYRDADAAAGWVANLDLCI